MVRIWGIGILALGLVVVVAGLVLQATGATAVVFCSVVGAGVLLAIAGFVVWAVGAWEHRPRTPVSV